MQGFASEMLAHLRPPPYELDSNDVSHCAETVCLIITLFTKMKLNALKINEVEAAVSIMKARAEEMERSKIESDEKAVAAIRSILDAARA
ncbi:hypothetical protein EZV62_024095 [Acer yangbiense]|uniref:Uncharacterized protein n=1 Tax=Acer yangbiense TaxID=1000413 RepID=A0A5C7H3T4_9ROSI|nr:hypothetical protein EZV62_024095 [Acer yangbiense]